MAEIRPTTLSIRDRINAFLEGAAPSYEKRHLIEAIMGRSGQKAGIADFTPLGVPLNAYEAGSSLAQGNYGQAAMSALAATPNALMAGVVGKGAEAAAHLTAGAAPAKMAAEAPKSITNMSDAIRVMNNPTSPSRRGFLLGGAALGATAALPDIAGKVVETVVPKAAEAAALTPESAHMAALQANLKAIDAHDRVIGHINSQGNNIDPEWIAKRQTEAEMASDKATEDSGTAGYIDNPDKDEYSHGIHHAETNPDGVKYTQAEMNAGKAAETARQSGLHSREYVGTDGYDPEYLLDAHDDAMSSHLDAAHEHMEQLQQITGKTPTEIYQSLPDGPEKRHILDYVLHDTHQTEGESHDATFYNFGAVQGDNSIYSKTSKGGLESFIDPRTGEVEHEYYGDDWGDGEDGWDMEKGTPQSSKP